MPIVFVHGVATRESAEQKLRMQQRDQLFKKLVADTRIFSPYWGEGGVAFDPDMPWLPHPGATETLQIGTTGHETTKLSELATQRPELAIDIAFAAALEQHVIDAKEGSEPSPELSPEQLAQFESAIRYLDQPSAAAFDASADTSGFLQALESELGAHRELGVETLGWPGDRLKWVGRGIKRLIDPVGNISSDAVLRLVRRPMSAQVALFLGDVLVYLRWRNTDGANGTGSRIFDPICRDLIAAAKLRSDQDPLIVVCHSLGGVILYDLLSDAKWLEYVQRQSGGSFSVDALITVGSQVGVVADMGLYPHQPDPVTGRRGKPQAARVWLNIFDYTDILSFKTEGVFSDVTDFEFDSISSLLSAHSSYFQRPGFYRRLKKRLLEAKVLT